MQQRLGRIEQLAGVDWQQRRAVTEQLAMHVAPSQGAARAREEAFDTIDGLVEAVAHLKP